MKIRLTWAAVVLLATYAVFAGGGWAGIYESALRALSVALSGIGLAIWFLVAIQKPDWRPRSVLLPALGACLLSLAVSTMFSRDPRISAEYLGYAVVLAALYLLLVRLFAHPFIGSRLPLLAATLFLVIAGTFIFLVVAHWVEWWGLIGRITVPPLRPATEGLTFLNPSAVLTMVALLAVPALAIVHGSVRRQAAAYVTIAVIVGVVALLSGSRGGWLALALTGLLASLYWVASANRRARLFEWVSGLVGGRAGRVLIVAVVVGAFASSVAFGPAVVQRASEGGEALRTTYIAASFRMFIEAPLVGTGPGTWVIQRPAYTADTEPDYYIPHAHNIEAQTFAELGILGTIAGGVVLLSLLRLIREGTRDARPARRRWAWATAAGLIYLALHQQLDFYANMPAVLFAAAIPIAYLDATGPTAVGSRESNVQRFGLLGNRTALVATIAVAIAIAGLLVQELPAAQMTAAVNSADDGDWVAAAPAAAAAANADSQVGAYQMMAALAAAHLGDHVGAVILFERVTAQNDLPEAWLDLAAERQLQGDTAGGIAALQSALRLGIQRPAVAVPAGDLALRLGRPDLATSAFAASIANAPSIAADPWWHQDSQRQMAYVDAIEEAIAAAPASAKWEIMLMSGDAARARALAAMGHQGTFTDTLIDAWTGATTAAQVIFDHCRLEPFDNAGLAWCARLAARQGDGLQAARWRRVADILIGGTSANGAELRIATSPTRSDAAGNPALFWSTFTFRRPGPSDLLVPSLVHLTLE